MSVQFSVIMRCHTASAMVAMDKEKDLFISFGDALLDEGSY